VTSNTTVIMPTAEPAKKDREFELRLAHLAEAGSVAIGERLDELDSAWTAGRATKATAGALIVLGLAFTAIGNPWWLILPAIGGLFLLQYSVSKTSWLAAMYRRIGLPSRMDIDNERFALRTLRGDYRHLRSLHDAEDRHDIDRFEGEGGTVIELEDAKPTTREVVKDVIHAAKA